MEELKKMQEDIAGGRGGLKALIRSLGNRHLNP